ncbi:MAG: SUMF1/EgtB/PvdO family nonheme iron enzyme [Armatimonadetes bacterium]|nr:SUMF1/EgtB/PvdO family nonheme iron enzyme [Armatimonadota bacterium]
MRTLAVVLALSLIAVRAVAAPIHDASGKGDLAKVKAVLARDAKLLNLRDADGATPLHFAVAGGQKAVVEYLLLKKADVNAKKKDGVTPLHVAASLAKVEIAKLLLAKGANKDAADSKGRTPLTLAGEKGDTDLISLLSGKATPPKPGVKVISIPKDAVVMRAGKKLAGVKKGTELKLGDVLEAGKSGDLVIHIGDISAIRLKPGAKLKLTKLTLTGELDIRTDLEKGDALVRVRALTGQSRFQMASPGAIVAVKGTAFAVKVKGSESTVVVAEGKVGVSLPSDPSREVEVMDGEMVAVKGRDLPRPEPVGAEQSVIIQQMLKEALPAGPREIGAKADGPPVSQLLSDWPEYLRDFVPTTEARFRVCAKDGMPQVLILSGEFTMGNDSGDEAEKPAKKVFISAFWMDMHEVTYEQYARFLNDVKPDDDQRKEWLKLQGEPQAEHNVGFAYGPKISFDDGKYVAQEEFRRYPAAWVTWQGADAYAKWAGRSLPTEAQWERAARAGKEGQTYVWGEGPPTPGAGNFADESYKKVWPKLSALTGYNDGFSVASPVCSFRPNTFSLYDMAGNLSEFCLDVYALDWYSRMPDRDPVNLAEPTPPPPGQSGDRVRRGGHWATGAFGPQDRVLRSLRLSERPVQTRAWDNTGFRCVSPAGR